MEPLSLTLQVPRGELLSGLLRMSQQAATRHLDELGLTGYVERQGLVWVIVRTHGKFFSSPGETLDITTWPGKSRAGLMPRHYQMFHPDGTPCLHLVSLWALADAESRKMRPDVAVPLPELTLPQEIPLPRAFPRRSDPLLGQFTVTPDYIDRNGHMNNAAYLEPVAPFLKGRLPREFTVDYRAELLPGQRVDVCGQEEENALYLSGKVGDGEHFRMRFFF